MAAPFIAFDKVWKTYGTGEARVDALAGVDLQIGRGEFVAIMGPSGSGKSTAMNIIGCLDTPTSGRYSFLDVDAGRLGRSERALLRNLYIGFVFQGYNLLPRTTAVENVELPLIYRGVSARERRKLALDALAKVGLAGRGRHTPAELSGGQQQRVAIARAIVANPTLLVADEPTGNLDEATGRQVAELLFAKTAERGATLVVVTHDPNLASRCGRMVRLRSGRIEPEAQAA